ncbi:MAG: tRNA (N(6)-L-threonylcarbamoyladenosine(37)-C(2))-methylthiotransferase MtaB [Planctomycetota bacterium]|nr:tRNA (N(6)-L-threonylcarbamoyladenosine(37)-C(2))-methylthiotransferase MtaB [Planctomycetota bacterium]
MPALLKTVTLGCKVNQYETQFVREGLIQLGYQPADDADAAELCVVNTCTITNEGDAKSRQVIRRLARENPDSRIVVMGCYATRAPEEVAGLPNVAEVVTDKRELPDLLGRFGLVDIPSGISGFGTRHRAYVKVQDGCLLRCSYCIIPHVRPQMESRPMREIQEEVRRLVDNGYQEIVLTGIHLGHYGVEQNMHRPRDQWVRLSSLVEKLVSLPGKFRLRLSSIEATEVTRPLLQLMADHADRICPHLHVCLQSGANSVLRRMKRRWSAQAIIDRCQLIDELLDQPALTTDVIVGFPGETDKEFEQTWEVVKQIGFSKIHTFPFSPRRGTPAAEMKGQIPRAIKRQRSAELGILEEEMRQQYFSSLLGRELNVLVESAVEGRIQGTAGRYVPVESTGSESQLGQLVPLTAESLAGDRLMATGHRQPR